MPAIALSLVNVTKRFGVRPILDNLSLGLMQGEKVGLIGRNGAGKSTLFKLLSGEDHPDAGDVIVTGGLSIARLSQEPTFAADATVREALEAAMEDHRVMLERYTAIHDQLAIDHETDDRKLHAELENIEHHLHAWGWDLAPRVAAAASYWGLLDLDAPVSSLSGGWRKRVALAQAWLKHPDVLVLDEPTNHLDPDQVERLQAWLLDFPGALLLITHDRHLLDSVVDRMFELENGRITTYDGGYSDYLLLKADQDFREARLTDHMQNRLRTELAWLRRGAKARTRKSKLRIEEVLDLKDEVGERTKLEARQTLSFQSGGNRSDALINGRGLRFSYSDATPELLDGIDLVLQRGMRIALLGPNGCGKSTLLKLLLGELTPVAGELTRHPKLQVTTLSQGRGELDGTRDLLWNLCEGTPTIKSGDSIVQSHVYLMRFGFAVADQKRDAASLSGGERNRLLLAKAMLGPADLLVLDEPTNDLDIPTLQNLEDALSGFPGTLLLVSHDRFFLDQVATHTLAWSPVAPKWELYEGNPTTVKEMRANRAAEIPATDSRPPTTEAKSSVSPKQKKSGLTQKEQRRFSEVESTIAKLHARITALDAKLADPAAFLSAEAPGHQALKDRDAAKADLDALEMEWLTIEERRSEV